MNHLVEQVANIIISCDDNIDAKLKEINVVKFMAKHNNTFYNLVKNKLLEYGLIPKNPKKGYLYVLHNEIYNYYGDCVYKLGLAIDVDKRKKNYTTSYIADSDIKHKSKNIRNIILAEKVLFIILMKHRIRSNREFFYCELNKIIETVKYIENLFDELSDNEIYIKYEVKLNKYCKFLLKKLDNIKLFKDDSTDKKVKVIKNKNNHYINEKKYVGEIINLIKDTKF